MNDEKKLRFLLAKRLLASDDHDGALVIVLYDTFDQTGVALDVANDEEAAEKLADEYMTLLRDDEPLEIRVVALSFDDNDNDEDDDV
jgi:hypothetical protein